MDQKKELTDLIDKYTSTYVGCRCMIPAEIELPHDDGYGGVHKVIKKIYVDPPNPMTDESMANAIMKLMDDGPSGMMTISKRRIESLLFDERLVKYFREKNLLCTNIALEGTVCNYKSFMEILRRVNQNCWSSMFRAISRRPPTFDKQETKDMLIKMIEVYSRISGWSVNEEDESRLSIGKVALTMMTKERYIDSELISILVAGSVSFDKVNSDWPLDLLWNIDNCMAFIKNIEPSFEMLAKIMIHAQLGGDEGVIKYANEYVDRTISSTDKTVSWFTRIGMHIDWLCPKYGIELPPGVLRECVNESNFLYMLTSAASIYPCKICGLADNVPGILANGPHIHDISGSSGYGLSYARRCMRIYDMLIGAGFTPDVPNMSIIIVDGDIDIVLKNIGLIDFDGFESDPCPGFGLTHRECSSSERIMIVDALVRKGWKIDANKISSLLRSGDREFCSHVIRNYGDINMKLDVNNFLTYSTWNYSGEIVSLLLELGIDLDFVGPTGRNALYGGRHIGRLCDAGINPNICDSFGTTPLKYLMQCRVLGLPGGKSTQKLKDHICNNLVPSYAAVVMDSQSNYCMEMMYGSFLDMIVPTMNIN